MTNEEFIKLYWKQYLSLEKDLIATDEYVSIDGKNNATFSNQYAKLFVMVCTEIDSLSVEFSSMLLEKYPQIDTNIKGNNILKRMDIIRQAYKKIGSYHVRTKFPFSEIHIVPFDGFAEETTDEWWKDYNDVKHKRTEKNSGGKYNYEKANLKNTMHAMAALFLLCSLVSSHLNNKLIKLEPESELFEFVE